MAKVLDVTDQSFETEVLKSELPVIVDFWAEWCGPCKQIAPAVAALAEAYDGRVKVVKLNVDENHSTSGKYGIRAIPTFLAFRDGRVVEQLAGPRKATVEEMAKKLVG